MGNQFSSGRRALALCDVCGLTYQLKQLKALTVKTRVTNTMACPECWVPDQPQLLIGTFPVNDPQALRNPRTDQALGASGVHSSRDIQWGWAPVGGGDSITDTPNNLVSTTSVGTVTISLN